MHKYAQLSPTATLLLSTAAVYVTSYPNLFTVKFPILTFFRPGNHFNIISQIIFFLPTSIYACKQLNLHYLSTSFQFSFLAIVKSSFPRISILHFLAIIFGCSIWPFMYQCHRPISSHCVNLLNMFTKHEFKLEMIVTVCWSSV